MEWIVRFTFVPVSCWHRSNLYHNTHIMEFVWMILIGLVVGAIAKFLTPGKDPGGCIITILLGIGGALLAGFLGRQMGWYGPNEPAGFIASVIGAVIILLIFRLVSGKRGA